MNYNKLKQYLDNIPSVSTRFSHETFFIEGVIQGNSYDCIALCNTKNISPTMDILIHRNAILNTLFLEKVSPCRYVMPERFLNQFSLLFNKIGSIYIVIEMKDGNKLNFSIERDNYFIDYPAGYSMNNIKEIYFSKMFYLGEIIEYDEMLVSKIEFKKSKQFVCCPINDKF